MPGNEKYGGAFTQGWKPIVRIRVMLFGGLSTLILLMACFGYWRGVVSGKAVLSILIFSLVNLAISRMVDRAQSPSWVENGRFVVNALLLPFVYAFTDGSYSPFWFPYCIMCLSVPTTTYLFTENSKLCFGLIGFWVVHFAVFSWVEHKFADPYAFGVAAALVATPGLYIVYLMTLMRKTLLSERATGQALTEVQAQLARSGKLTALGEMAGGMAHEINNPLAVIKTSVGEALELLEEKNPDLSRLKELGGSIERMTDRIARIVKGLRTFARDGSQDPFDKVRVRELLDDTFSLCRERFNSSGIQVTVNDFDPDLVFAGRAIEISQVLLNLLTNAYDVISSSDAPDRRWIKVEVNDQAETVEIRVTDGGKGLTEEVKTKLFQPFFTTKEVGKGVGLGLSISLGVMKNHHGELTLDPTANNTTFVVRLRKRI